MGVVLSLNPVRASEVLLSVAPTPTPAPSPTQGVQAAQPDSIRYRIRWWVAPDGHFTKIYSVTYSGQRLIQRWRDFSSGVDSPAAVLRRTLPALERTDRLLSEKKLTDTDQNLGFEWIYTAPSRPPGETLDNLVAWLPVWADPMLRFWEPEDDSRYRFRSAPVHAWSEIELRGPWPFEHPAPVHETALLDKRIEARIKILPLEQPSTEHPEIPGFDQHGMLISSEVQTLPGKLTPEDVAVLDQKNQLWQLRRLQPAVWAGPAQDPMRLAYDSRPHFSWQDSLGYGNVGFDARGYSGLEAAYGLRYEKYLGRGWSWRLAQLDFLAILGLSGSQDPTSNHFVDLRLLLGSSLNYRVPFLIGSTDGERGVSFVDFFAGPAMQQAWFSDWTSTNSSASSLDPVLSLGVRWGFSGQAVPLLAGASISAAFTLKWELFSAASVGGSRFIFGLEVL